MATKIIRFRAENGDTYHFETEVNAIVGFPDVSKYLTTDTQQLIDGRKIFVGNGAIRVSEDGHYQEASTSYNEKNIIRSAENIDYQYDFPNSSGTFALLGDIKTYTASTGIYISDSNEISTTAASSAASGHVNTTTQTFAGRKTFSGGINISGTGATIQLGGSSGSSGQVLTSNGTSSAPSWKTPVTYHSGTGITISTSGEISTSSATATDAGHVSAGTQTFGGRKTFDGGINIPSGATIQLNGSSGTAGYVLTSNGTSSSPTWKAIPSGGGSALDAYPVGSIYLCWYYASSTTDTYHPAKLFGGSWTAIPSGYALWTYRSSVSSADSAHEVSAGLPNITGKFGNLYLQRDSADSNWSIINGAFKIDDDWDNHAGGTLLERGGQIKFDASMSNSIYGNSTTVQPPAYRVFAWRRTA